MKNNKIDKVDIIKKLEPIVFDIKNLNKNCRGIRELNALHALEVQKVTDKLLDVIQTLVDQDLSTLETKILH